MTRSAHRRLCGAATAALLVLCLPAAAQSIDPQQIQATWVGRTLHVTAPNGAALQLKLSADGTAVLTSAALNDSGTWRLSDDGYCATWKVIRNGAEACFTAVRFRSGEIRVTDRNGRVSGYINRVE